MIGPEIPLAALAAAGSTHMVYTDARWHEINPYAATITGAAATYYSAGFGTAALASSLGGIAAITATVFALRARRTNAFGLGDYSLLAACGALVGIDALLPFLMIMGLFGVIASFVAGQLRTRKRRWSVFPLATAAVPAAFIAALARYQYGATFTTPFSWVPL